MISDSKVSNWNFYSTASCEVLNPKNSNKKTGVQYWKIAEDFIKSIEEKQERIIVSTIVLKELYFTLKEKFPIINGFFKESDFIKIIKTAPEDYELARKWEEENKTLSFYDYLHTAIAKRLNLCLITRDEGLIRFAKNHVNVLKPEELS